MATAKTAWFGNSKDRLDAVLLEVCEEVQLARTRYDLAVERYGTVNRLLEKVGSPFQFVRPRIFPQGSMALGTTCKPVEGPHDLDFALQNTARQAFSSDFEEFLRKRLRKDSNPLKTKNWRRGGSLVHRNDSLPIRVECQVSLAPQTIEN